MGFNGAATFRLRKEQEAKRKAGGADASMGPQPFGCGRADPQLARGALRVASMGPQPFGCGRAHVHADEVVHVEGFNGAATFRLRKATRARSTRKALACFNGAATFRLRKAAAFSEIRSGV